MKQRVLLGAALALAGLLAGAAGAADKPRGDTGSYVHVVLFTVKKDAPKDAVSTAIADCHTMLGKIKAVRAVKVGRPAKDATPDVAKKDYDFALLILVDDAAGLKAYLEDPEHVAFVKKHGKHFDMDKLRVYDFADQKK
jgi:hypothetical protein